MKMEFFNLILLLSSITDESCCVGVDETFTFQVNETGCDVTTGEVCNSDVMWYTTKDSCPSSSSSAPDTPNSGYLKFHENSISELARKQVIAELPNFKPTILSGLFEFINISFY